MSQKCSFSTLVEFMIQKYLLVVCASCLARRYDKCWRDSVKSLFSFSESDRSTTFTLDRFDKPEEIAHKSVWVGLFESFTLLVHAVR